MGKIISRKELADLIGKSERWVSKLIEDGLPVAGGGGKGNPLQIDSQRAIDWLIAQALRNEMGDDDDEEGGANSGAKSEDRLLKRARREKLQIEIDAARSRLVPVDGVVFFLTTIAAVYATQLDAVASRLASDLAVTDDPAEIRAKLFDEMRRIRAATADRLEQRSQELVAQVGNLDFDSIEDGEGPAEADG
jgi:terminase small subunit / prophage DNA-packing protein